MTIQRLFGERAGEYNSERITKLTEAGDAASADWVIAIRARLEALIHAAHA